MELDGWSGTDVTVNNVKLGFQNKPPRDLMHSGEMWEYIHKKNDRAEAVRLCHSGEVLPFT